MPIAVTYARQPGYYRNAYCTQCEDYFPSGDRGEFVWLDAHGHTTDQRVGA